MLSYFSKKWKEAESWIKAAAFQAIQQSIVSKQDFEQPICRILCVDDDRSFCQFMKQLANSLDMQLDAVFSIKEAKEAIEDYDAYRAFIIDGHLPDGSGFEIVAWIREKKELMTPIGFISRIYQDSKSFRILKEGLEVDYVLEKPIRPAEVHQLLIQLCQIETDSSSDEFFSDELLSDLKASYQKTISDKIERLENMILNIQKNPSIEHLEQLQGEVHKIAGSAGSYGYMAVSDLCKNLELDLINKIDLAKREQLNRQWLFTLDDFFTQIKLHFQFNFVESDQKDEKRARHLPAIYIIDEDPNFLNSIIQSQASSRFDILTETLPERAVQTLLSADIFPQILLLNSHYHSSVLTGYDLIQAFYKRNDYLTTTIAMMVNNSSLNEQIEALQKGMFFTLVKPFSMPLLLPLLDQTFYRPLFLSYKILIVDEDRDICEYILNTLKYHGNELKAVHDPDQLEEVFHSYKPDLILLNINLKDRFGNNLLEKIRKDWGYEKLLVGLLAINQQETYLIQKCYEANVNEILFKPLEGYFLQRKIGYLIKKQAEEAISPKIDPVTGLNDFDTLKRYLNELQLQSVNSVSKVLVIFELELSSPHSQKIDKEVLNVVSESLHELLNKFDMAAYLDHGRFALSFLGIDPNFIQIFMRPFLVRLHSKLQTFVKKHPFYINEGLERLSMGETAESVLDRMEVQLNLVKELQQEENVRMIGKQSFVDIKEVYIFHDEGQNLDFVKDIFEENSFKVTLITKSNEFLPESVISLPLYILMGSWASSKGLRLLKKIALHSQIQTPLLSLPHLPDKNYLMRFLTELNYLEFPFSLIILIGNGQENSKNQKKSKQSKLN